LYRYARPGETIRSQQIYSELPVSQDDKAAVLGAAVFNFDSDDSLFSKMKVRPGLCVSKHPSHCD
jgi:hypothetical protein